MDTIVIHSDGGYSADFDVGSWAYTKQVGQLLVEDSGAFRHSTNNRMELLAVIRALESLPPGSKVTVIADSEYVIKGATVWAHNWSKNGWVTYTGTAVKNRDLWEVMLTWLSVHSVTFQHVKGHSGHEGNERCDELCTAAILLSTKDIEAVELDLDKPQSKKAKAWTSKKAKRSLKPAVA